mmetsp:Transcript_21473/g.48359  ORF Transcript_21473/g.48359 Transcript_21473/m.48359 type:complete len:150 (+) Transcript_21473:1405-1854(+)
MPSHRSLGVQLFRDYVRAFHIVDPWLISNYLAGDNEVAAYERLTQGAEIDSSVVVIDTVRAWRYVHVVAALNWWKAIIDRHAWGDKDTWALAALVLQAADGTVDGVASTVRVLWVWICQSPHIRMISRTHASRDTNYEACAARTTLIHT